MAARVEASETIDVLNISRRRGGVMDLHQISQNKSAKMIETSLRRCRTEFDKGWLVDGF